jgi:Protein of unknown function (DUF1488)
MAAQQRGATHRTSAYHRSKPAQKLDQFLSSMLTARQYGALAKIPVTSMEGTIVAEITFPEGAQGNEEFVEFRAQVDGETVQCRILLEALANRFEGQLSNTIELLTVFRANRPAIETIARRLINSRRFEPDRSIIIRGADV